METPGIYRQQHFEQDPLKLPLSTFHSLLGDRGRRLYPHWHDRLELFYVKDGYGQMQIDLSYYDIAPGDVVVVSCKQLHGGWGVRESICACEVVVFDLSMLRGMFTDRIALQYIDPPLQQSVVFTPVLHPGEPGVAEIITHIDHIIDLNARKPPAYELELKAHSLMLLSYLFTHHHYTDRAAGGAPRELAGLKEALSYIYDHLSEPLSADGLSEVAQYSKYHFLRMFKRHMGITTTAYINLMRLERAARLLRTTDLSVTDICARCGFGNVSYFIKCFSRHYGVTPLAFRKAST